MSEFIIECEYDFDDGWIPGEHREEIVRCRDCVHWHHMDEVDGVRYGECDEFSPKAHYEKHATREFGFCAWGVRRGDVE